MVNAFVFGSTAACRLGRLLRAVAMRRAGALGQVSGLGWRLFLVQAPVQLCTKPKVVMTFTVHSTNTCNVRPYMSTLEYNRSTHKRIIEPVYNTAMDRFYGIIQLFHII